VLVSSSDDLGDLIRQAQAGSNEAAEIVFERCRVPLLSVIRRTLSQPLRRLFDSEDFLLDAFTEIFTRKFTEEVLSSPGVLWRYLQNIAENKVCDARRKYLRAKRFNISHDVATNDDQEMVSKDLPTEDTLLLQELVEQRVCDFLEKLPLVHRRVVEFSIKGKTVEEIAHILHLTPKLVYHCVHSLKIKLNA